MTDLNGITHPPAEEIQAEPERRLPDGSGIIIGSLAGLCLWALIIAAVVGWR